MIWKIRMSDVDAAGQPMPDTARVLDAELPSEARACAFVDGILEPMRHISFRRRPKFEIFEVPASPETPRQWRP